jgi:hypothetical protein
MWNVWARGEVRTLFRWRNLKIVNYSKLWRRWENNSKMDLKIIWIGLGIHCSVSG